MKSISWLCPWWRCWPWWGRRGRFAAPVFLWGKVVFGSLTVVFAALGSAGIIISVQHKTGLSALPLAWLVLPALIFALYRISRIKAE